MSFGSIIFLFAFLPISLILYFISPKKVKPITLIVISLVFYSWGSPKNLIFLGFSVLFNYISGIEIGRLQEEEEDGKAKVTMIVAVVVNVLILLFYKYFAMLVGGFGKLFQLEISEPRLSFPLGLSFFTFSALSYIIDVYTKKSKAQTNFIRFAEFMTFFPKLVSGPIVQYHNMEEQIADRKMSFGKAASGMALFVVGLGKKVILADGLYAAYQSVTAGASLSVASAWFGILLYAMQLYFDFSGYSDMAIGLAKVFGYQFDKNFNYPFQADSISEFWRRWHISLVQWFQQYIYFPLGGSRGTTAQTVRNTLIVWIVTGMWHGSQLHYIVWGLYQFVALMVEKHLLKDFLDKLPHWSRYVLTVFFTAMWWPIFFSSSMTDCFHYFGQMFGAGHLGFIDSTFEYYFSGNLLLTIIGVLGITNFPSRLHSNLVYRRGGAAVYVSAALYVLLLIICTAYLMNSTYSAFQYFQF